MRLRAAAHLYGIQTIALTQARVLHIGCGVGQHILSFALAYPDARAVGLCANEAEARAARNLAVEAEAQNICFLSMELVQIDATLGEFDYVMVRGLYESLPPESAILLLQTCESLLSPLGLLCLDYPIYPGAKAFEVVRDAMLMHCHDNEDPSTMAEQARAALVLFNEGIAASNPMGPALRQAAATLDMQLRQDGPAAILSAQGSPCYFLELVNRALQAGLICSGDAEPMLDIGSHWGLNVGVTNSVLSIGQTGIMRLQYLDLATGRARRHTLLVKAARNTGLRDRPELDRLSDFRWASGWERSSWALPDTNGQTCFRDHRGRRWTSPDAVCTLILDTLALAWPTTLSFQSLADTIAAMPSLSGAAPIKPDPIDATRSALRVMLDANIVHYCLDNGPYDALKHDVGRCVPGLIEAVQNSGVENFNTNCKSWPVINLWHEPIANIFSGAGLQLLTQLFKGVQAEFFVSSTTLGTSIDAVQPGLSEVSAELLRQLKASAALRIQPTIWLDLLSNAMSWSAGQTPCWSLYLAARHSLTSKSAPAPGNLKTEYHLTPQQQNQIVRLEGLINQLAYTAAEPIARQLTERLPDHIAGPAALVRCLVNTGRHLETLALLQSMLHLHSNDARFISLLAVTLAQLTVREEAMRVGQMVLTQHRSSSGLLNAMGLTCMTDGQLKVAESYFRQAITVDPNGHIAHVSLMSVLGKQGRTQEGLALCYELLDAPKAVPADVRALIYHNMLFLANYDAMRSAEEIRQDYQRFEDELCRPFYPKWRSHRNNRNVNRPLRIGYVSADFRDHAVSRFLLPVFEHHDRSTFEIYGYSNMAQDDKTTEAYRAAANTWVPIRGMSDDDAAARIRADEIDILVDTSGHTLGNRLGIFARKPAPVSMSWLGYGYTSGVSAIDYFLGNAVLCPEDSGHLFAEAPWRMPRATCVYRPRWGEIGASTPLPALQKGRITLVCLSRSIRINERVIRVWADILHAIPGSRLVINSADYVDQTVCKSLLIQFAHRGIEENRIMLGYTSPPWPSLRHADIGLDCFPHNAGTTLLDMLCMGVPYVTLADRPSVGRIGATHLQALGRPEWIAYSEQEYVNKVVALAQDTTTLARIRETLPTELKKSPITNEVEFTRDLEDAYRAMFRKWTDSKNFPKN